MYKYMLSKNKGLVTMFDGEEKVCEASILVEDNVAILNFTKLGITKNDSMMSIAAKCCSETKKLLEGVDKVQLGSILEVAKYDEALERIAKDFRRPIRSSMR